jgi:glycosyltransferase involved in cell wall biosynthesis
MISVLLPTRGRPDSLRESIDSLLDNADDPRQVEVLCAVDSDDEVSATVCLHLDHVGVSAWISPERYGYARLHEYVNFLAGHALGDWLMLWNDDARMLTEGWDTVVMEQSTESVLWSQCNHDEAGNLFPIWPQAWYHELGYVSWSPNIDVWISEIGRRLGIEKGVPVQVMHDRPDVTGSAPDQTFLDGRAKMGQWNHPDYDSWENRLERTRVVQVLGSMYARA